MMSMHIFSILLVCRLFRIKINSDFLICTYSPGRIDTVLERSQFIIVGNQHVKLQSIDYTHRGA